MRATAVDMLRERGQDYFVKWCDEHRQEIGVIYGALSMDPTTYNLPGISHDHRSKVLLEYAVGEVMIINATEQERERIFRHGAQLHQKNSAALGRLIIALVFYVPLLLHFAISIAAAHSNVTPFLVIGMSLVNVWLTVVLSCYVLNRPNLHSGFPAWGIVAFFAVNTGLLVLVYPLSEWYGVKERDNSIDSAVSVILNLNMFLSGFFVGLRKGISED